MGDFPVDVEAFERLLRRRFRSYRGLVLLESNWKEKDIDRLLESHPAKEVQWLENHQELFFYASFDITKQREFGVRLKKHWEQRLPIDCPDIPAYVEIRDEGSSVVVTVLNESFLSA